jgi:hypothetical protein
MIYSVSLSLYDVVIFYVQALSQDIYEYDNPTRSKHTRACPCEHSQQLL